MIDELQRFIEVSHSGNFTNSAKQLFITQSALSQSIKRLEIALGTKLFRQTGKHLQLTDDGVAVQKIGMQIIQLWKNLQDPQMRKITQPTYSIGMFDNAAIKLGSYFQKNFTSEAYHLELIIDSSKRLISQLQWGLLDIAICVIDKSVTLPKNITLMKTFSEELIPVSSHSFSGPVQNIPFILYNKDSHTRLQIDSVFTHNSIKPNIFADSTSTTFMKELALLGNGVALLPENAVKSELSQKTLKKIRLPMKWQREYGMYIHSGSKLERDHIVCKEILNTLKGSLV